MIPRWALSAAVMLVALCAAACIQEKSAAEAAKEYELQGEVLRLNAKQRIATIRHGKIEGWMEAMTMDFPVRDGEDLHKLQPGARIHATVFVQGFTFSIGKVRPADTRK
ncbi:MAG TPA: copper-binding protein [Bryobacteraceae bacterium]|nr:copper-binding protein [Bryobacteraceae bacterium]